MNQKVIYLAGGCFWGVEAFMRRIDGIVDTECGYANGRTENPRYEDVCTGESGHVETVRVRYDGDQTTLQSVLSEFFTIVHLASAQPSQYRNGIFFDDERDHPICQAALTSLQAQRREPLILDLCPLSCFYEAEAYHQDYLEKNPNGFCHVDLSRFKQTK